LSKITTSLNAAHPIDWKAALIGKLFMQINPNFSFLESASNFTRSYVFSIGALLVLLPVLAQAQPQADSGTPNAVQLNSLSATRVNAGEQITLDPDLSAPAWARAKVFEFNREREPNFGAQSPYVTKVKTLFDDKAIYFGIQALDPNPELIRAPLVRHDNVFRTMDFVAVYIDTSGDKKSAQFFRSSAIGLTGDGLHTSWDDKEDFAPDYEFTSAAKITAQGYNVVIRVPYGSLRFDPKSVKPWRLMFVRRIPREQVALTISVELARKAPSFIDEMQSIESLTPPTQQQFLELRPTVTVRQIQELSPNKKTETKFKPSLDFKWQPQAQWVVDGTINPDFSQVELDVAQLSRNNSFALFRPEKRPLFLESADLLSAINDAVYTRSIQNPKWALRSSWRGDLASATALASHDNGGGLTLLPGAYGNDAATQPANNAFLARAQLRDMALLVSHRQYEQKRGENTVLGWDQLPKFSDTLQGRFQLLASQTTALPNGEGELTRQQANTGIKAYGQIKHNTDATTQFIELEYVAPKFRNDTGFNSQNDYQRIKLFGQRRFYGDDEKPIDFLPFKANEFNVFLNTEYVQQHSTGKTIYASVSPGFYVNAGKLDLEVSFQPRVRERIREDAPLQSAYNMHAWGQYDLSTMVPNVSGYVDFGKFDDYAAARVRPGIKAGLSAKLRPFERLEIEPKFDWSQLRGAVGGSTEKTTVVRESAFQVLGIWHIAPRQFLRIIAQKSSFNRQADSLFNVSSAASKNQTTSLTYIWRQSVAQSLYVGLTAGKEQSPGSVIKSREAYVKWQTNI
jgi:Domain of unknown function (DUF5916)